MGLSAAENAFFRQQLEHIKARVYEKIYPDRIARDLVPPAADPAPAGAEVITYRVRDRVGMMKLIMSYADDLPTADVFVKEHQVPVKLFGMAYQYSRRDLRQAQLTGRSLSAERIEAARDAGEETFDDVIAVGRPDHGVYGLLNNENVPQGLAAQGASTDRDWPSKTPAEIEADFHTAIETMLDDTNGREAGPFRVLVPTDRYAMLSRIRVTDSIDRRLLRALQEDSPYIESIRPWWRCKGAGAGDTNRMVLYTPSQDVLEYEEPMPFTIHEPEWVGLVAEGACEMELAGTIVKRPLAMRYVDGI